MEVKLDPQAPSWGVPSHIIPYPGKKGARGAHPAQEQLPAPAAPSERKRRAGAGEEGGRAWREQHEKANPLPIVSSCAMLQMSLWVSLLFHWP